MQTDVSATVTMAWCAALNLPDGPPAPDFFQAGGTSLTALQLMERIESELGIEFPLETLFLDGALSSVIEECRRRCSAATGQ